MLAPCASSVGNFASLGTWDKRQPGSTSTCARRTGTSKCASSFVAAVSGARDARLATAPRAWTGDARPGCCSLHMSAFALQLDSASAHGEPCSPTSVNSKFGLRPTLAPGAQLCKFQIIPAKLSREAGQTQVPSCPGSDCAASAPAALAAWPGWMGPLTTLCEACPEAACEASASAPPADSSALRDLCCSSWLASSGDVTPRCTASCCWPSKAPPPDTPGGSRGAAGVLRGSAPSCSWSAWAWCWPASAAPSAPLSAAGLLTGGSASGPGLSWLVSDPCWCRVEGSLPGLDRPSPGPILASPAGAELHGCCNSDDTSAAVGQRRASAVYAALTSAVGRSQAFWGGARS